MDQNCNSSCRIMGPAGKLLRTTLINNWNRALKLMLLPKTAACSQYRQPVQGEHTLSRLVQPQRCPKRKITLLEIFTNPENTPSWSDSPGWRTQHMGSFRSYKHPSNKQAVKTHPWAPPKELRFKDIGRKQNPAPILCCTFTASFFSITSPWQQLL